MSTAAIVAGTVGAGVVGAVGSSKAAGAQSKAAMSAAQLEAQSQANALAEQRRQFDITQGNLAPFLKVGTSAVNTLGDLLKTPGQGLLTPWTGQFQAPTAEDARNTPGYQFMQDQGQRAIQNSAASSGGLLSTGTQKSLLGFSQGLADSTYSETYNRSFNEYLQGYNQFQNNQTNEFNRLAAASGMGQTTATTLGSLGQQNASTIGNIYMQGGAQQGSDIMAAGNARASGYAGMANAFAGIGNNLSQYLLLNAMIPQTSTATH